MNMEEQSINTVDQNLQSINTNAPAILISDEAASAVVATLRKTQQDLQTERQPRDQKWLQVNHAASDGKMLDGRIADLMKNYTEIEESTYPGLVWQSFCEKIALIKPDILKIYPRGKKKITDGDLMLADIVTEFIKQKHEHEESNFQEAWESAIWYATVLNMGIVHTCWHRVVRKAKQYEVVNNGVSQELKVMGEVDELDYQGPVYTAISPFDFWFDHNSGRIDKLDKLSTFHLNIVNYDDLCENPVYDPNDLTYFNKQNVLYRNNIKLKELKDPKVSLTDNEKKSRDLTGQSNDVKRSVRLFVSYQNYIKCEGKIYRDVCVHYVVSDGTTNPIPLLIEYNPNQYNWSAYTYLVPRKIPNKVYSKSQTELAFNQYALATYYQSLELASSTDAVFGTEFYPSDLPDSVGQSPDEFQNTLNTPGRRVGYDSSVYKGNGGDIFSPQRDIALKALPVIQQQKQVAKQAQSETHTDLMTLDVEDSTATGVKAVAAKRDLQQTNFIKALSRALQRSTKLVLADMKRYFTDESMMIDLDEKDIQSLLNDNPDGIIRKTSSVGLPVVAQVDQVTKKKIVELQSFLLSGFEGETRIVMDGNQVSKVLELDDTSKMFDMAEKLGSPGLGRLAAQRYVQITDMPEGKEALDIIEQELAAKQQPDPNAQAQVEAQVVTAQANAQQKAASAEHLSAQAAQKRQEVEDNELAKQILLG